MWKMEKDSCTLGQSTIINFMTVDNTAYPIKQLGLCQSLRSTSVRSSITALKADEVVVTCYLTSYFGGNFFHVLSMNALFGVRACARARLSVC